VRGQREARKGREWAPRREEWQEERRQAGKEVVDQRTRRSASGGGLAEQAEEEEGGGPRTVGMGKAAESSRMRHGGGLPAKYSSCCGSYWRCNSILLFLILKMHAGMQYPLESV
jgi:hypothetical protein